LHSSRSGGWLDLGCGHDVVPPWAAAAIAGLSPRAGVDPDVSSLRQNTRVKWRVAAQGEQLPFADGTFELVTANMVLEHVAAPERLFREVARVLRAPLAERLHGRAARDVYPTHYRANTEPVLRRLSSEAGFASCRVEYIHSSPQLIRIPPLLVGEMLLIRVLSIAPLRRFRACLIAGFDRQNTRS
jgi:SAM-dependent methyltransferase